MEGPKSAQKALSPRWPLVALPCLVLLTSFPVLQNDFAWDDGYLVLKNETIEDPQRALEAFFKPWAHSVGYELGDVQNRPYYRPLTILSMALDFAVAGPDPLYFHAVNLVIHLLSTIFLYLWLSKFPQIPGLPSSAFWIALFWALHPVHTEAIALVSYRTTLLSGMFLFCGLWASAKAKEALGDHNHKKIIAFYACALLSYLLALLSKETAIIFPALLLLSDISVRPRPDLKKGVVVYGILAVFSIGYLLLRAHVVGKGIYDWFEGLSGWQKALMVPKIFYLYVRLCLIPYPLSPFYDWNILGVPKSFFEADIIAGLLLLLLIPALIVLLWKPARLIAFGLAFFLLALLPFSHIVPFFDAAGERFLYCPLAGMAIALYATGRRFWNTRLRRLLGPGALIALAALATLSHIRLREWKDSETILRAGRRDFPNSVSFALGLGRLFLSEERHKEALTVLKDAVRLAPSLVVARGLLAVAQALNGDIKGAKDTIGSSPLPEPGLPSAAQIARRELLQRGRVDLVRAIGL